jgi:hypothetical protein
MVLHLAFVAFVAACSPLALTVGKKKKSLFFSLLCCCLCALLLLFVPFFQAVNLANDT